MKMKITIFLMTTLLTIGTSYSINATSDDSEDTLDLSSPEIQQELAQADIDTEKAKNSPEVDPNIEEELELLKKENPDEYKQIAGERNKTYASGKMGKVGDILTTYDNSTSSWRHGHDAIVQSDNSRIMEAWAGKGVRNYQNNWSKRFKSKKKQYVKGADIYDKVKAQRYASSKTGKPYSVATTKKNTNKYYCSKLVWQSYKNTKGTDLDSNGGALVTPADIDRSSKTVSY
ncbi:YiiX/YebB-like N1pC/P60 family cysteine hydrolase [Bacillus velezensis]|uniref:YiiX/YebB-like N1pC/P60 family cysteine hydrolase n=1 Tax=Bacillus velezensis TaxID=492670 RepID=UPI002DBF8637|nr:YiiX/YebB-like N1pC/P60 family cysteine hydrolase [Bacillus velezensis]MEC2352609.1 YiiX/YebB-like N1pC/P60 family cysteine hydrolase [Bacillus velezensis]